MTPEWERRRIATFAKRSKVVNVGGDLLPPLSITKGRGVILQSEKYNKQIATDLRKYVIARHGQFAFDPMSLYYGAIGQVAPIEVGLVSPDYVVFDIDDTVDGAFLNYYLRWPDQIPTYEAVAETGNQFGKRRRVYWSVFENLEVRLPPLGEQRRIAAILASVGHAIEATQAVIDQLQVVKKAMMAELLTRGLPGRHARFKQTEIGDVPEEWEIVGLMDVVEMPGSQVDPRERPFCKWPLIAPNHIESRTGRLLSVESAEEQGAISGKYRFTPRDVVYSKIRPYLRKAWLADREGICSADMYPLRPKSRIASAFLLCVLLGEHFSSFAESVSMRTGIPKINRKEMAAYRFALPSKPEQEEIGSALSALTDREDVEARCRQQLEGIKAALLSALLTGELRVTPYESAA